MAPCAQRLAYTVILDEALQRGRALRIQREDLPDGVQLSGQSPVHIFMQQGWMFRQWWMGGEAEPLCCRKEPYLVRPKILGSVGSNCELEAFLRGLPHRKAFPGGFLNLLTLKF